MSKAEQVRPPTMSKLVSEMETAGLVRRAGDPADARIVRVEMTTKGRRVLAKGRDLRIADIERRLRAQGTAGVASVAAAVDVIERMLRE